MCPLLDRGRVSVSLPCIHYEPNWRDGRIAGYLTSGNYGHYLGAAIGLGYVACETTEKSDDVLGSSYEIEVAGERVPALASLKPMYDPKSERVRGRYCSCFVLRSNYCGPLPSGR